MAQITEFSHEVKKFFANEDISMLVQQISRVLCIVQNTEMDIDECAKTLLNCAFDCFIPEMQEEVVRAQKQKKKNALTSKKTSLSGDKKAADDEDCLVQMQPIDRIEDESKKQN